MSTRRNGINFTKTVVFLISVLILTLTGCAGNGDWAYDDLPDDYSIWRINSQDIQFGKSSGNILTPVVGRYIIAFCHDDQYIGLQRIPLEKQYRGGSDIKALVKSNPEYYLIDSDTDFLYGPMTYAEYCALIIEL